MILHDQIGNLKEDPLLISESLFENAEDFFSASHILLQSNSNLFTVAYANLAFSCELYLKSILFQYKRDNKRISEHRLFQLYSRLPLDKQAEIKESCTFQYEKEDRFEAFFQEVSETYVFTRYIHERKSSCLSLDFSNLVMAVRNCSKRIYNSRVLDRNEEALRILEEYKSKNTDTTLEFYIYYNDNVICDMNILAKMITENLCDSLKIDFQNYKLGNKYDDWVKEPAIILYFTRQSFIYSFGYDNIMNVSSAIFKTFGITNKGLRTNGYRVFIQSLIK